MTCSHTQADSFETEVEAWGAAAYLQYNMAHPVAADRCAQCGRWAIHIVWKARDPA